MTPAGMTGAALVRQFCGRFLQFEIPDTTAEADRAAELGALLRDLWAGALIGADDAGFVNIPPAITRCVVAALQAMAER
jgi:hypothetical protein